MIQANGESAAVTKRTIWLGCLVLALSPAMSRADAPKDWTDRIYFGGQMGVNVSTFTGPGTNEELISYSYKLGMRIGGIAGVRLTEAAAAQLEMAYSTLGANYVFTGVESGTYRLRYFDMSLLAHFSLPLSSRLQCHGVLGPKLALLLDADLSIDDDMHFDINNSVNFADAGVVLGVGASIGVGKGSIMFDIRYNFGIANIDKTSGGRDDDVMNQAFYFTAGYRANLDDLLHGFRRKAPPPASKVPPASHAPEPDAAPTDTPAPDTEPATTEPMSPLDKPHAHPPNHL
jgi:hypothetical protein